MKRRDFIFKSILAGSVIPNPIFAYQGQSPFFEIGLAQWSLNKSLNSGKIDNLDFARIAREKFDIGVVEYVNQFFINKAKNKKYLSEMLNISEDNGIINNLIMIDSEGNLGDTNKRKRLKAINNHKKWVEAAKFIGCSHIRVNAAGNGSEEEVSKNASESLAVLGEFSEDFGINVIVENHGGLSSTGAWLSGVMKKVGMANCGTLPDFGNFCVKQHPEKYGEAARMFTMGAESKSDRPPTIYDTCAQRYDMYDGIKKLMKYAKGVSAKTHGFDINGNDVDIDYKKMLQIVKDSEYQGFIGVEAQAFTMDPVSYTHLTLPTKRIV